MAVTRFISDTLGFAALMEKGISKEHRRLTAFTLDEGNERESLELVSAVRTGFYEALIIAVVPNDWNALISRRISSSHTSSSKLRHDQDHCHEVGNP